MAVILTVNTNTWVTLDQADEYMSGRFGAAEFWEDLSDGDKKAALVTAYKHIKNSNLFTFPDAATQAMRDAQCEQALFIIQHQKDADQRLGLQSQGVVSAGIVKEQYRDGKGPDIAISAIALRFLDSIKKYGGALYAGDLTRDEDEDVE